MRQKDQCDIVLWDCNVELCQTCNTRHLCFEAMSEHRMLPIAEAGINPVVNVTKYCPKHVTKPIKLKCVPCKLAICLECLESRGP